MNETQRVQGFCQACGAEAEFELTRIFQKDGTGRLVLDLYSGACRTANHPMDEMDARSRWRS